ncbi:MAG: ABC transporter ATP-binding protein/permease [Defluviitaleaceae bacterium]|nr:ABC transporter ATP-binding protein/permease [Defluviitaleaceae bacterium]
MKKYLKEIQIWIILNFFIILLGAISTAFLPYIHMIFIDGIFVNNNIEFLIISLLYISLILVDIISGYFSMIISWKIGIQFENSLKRDFIMSLFLRPFEIFNKKSIPEYVSVQSNDLTSLEMNYVSPIISIAVSLCLFITYGLILFFLVDFRIAIILFITSVISVFLTNINSKKLSERRKDYLDNLEKYSNKVSNLLEGKKLISKSSIKNFEIEHEKQLQETASFRYIYGKNKSLVISTNGIVLYAINIIGFVFIAYLSFNGEISIGATVASLGYIGAFVGPLQEIISCITMLNSIKTVKEKVLKETESKYSFNNREIDKFQKNIIFENVSIVQSNFSLKNFNFTFKKGKKYAIIGHNGSGKSTIVNLLMGFLKQNNGTIKIDEIDINTLDASKIMFCVNQNEIMFEDDFFQNISLFSYYNVDFYKKISTKFDNFINKSMLETKNCKNLSGGEKQLISILRMINSNTDIWILDEAFSQIDENKYRELENIILGIKDKTIISVTHDTGEHLNLYDEILFLEKGELKEHIVNKLVMNQNSI